MECLSTSRMYGEGPWGPRLIAAVLFALLVAVPLLHAPASLATPGEHEVHEGMLHEAHSPSAAPDEYSLFMHHSSGIALVILGILVLSDRLTRGRIAALQLGIALIWLGFGAHLFVRSDPEGWPIGPAGFLESFSMPTSQEWIQHKLLSLIPLALGVWTLISRRRAPKAALSYALGGLLALGGAALLFHQHLEHQTMDIVNLQHRFMALTSLFIAGSAVADGIARTTSRVRPFLLPSGLMLLGLQLAIYVE